MVCHNSAIAKPSLTIFDELNADLMGHIEGIRDFLLARGRVTLSFTGSDSAFDTTRTKLSEWLDAMRDEPVTSASIAFQQFETPTERGISRAHSDCALCTRDASTALLPSGFDAADDWGTSHPA